MPPTFARLLPAFSVAVVLALEASYVWPFTIDDAFITARYASRLAHGLGYTFNTGPATDGVTGPLWLLPMILGEQLGCGALLISKIVASASVVAAGAAVALALARRSRGSRASWIAFAIMISSLPLVIAEINGLETGTATLTLTLAALCAYARPLPRALSCGAACAAIPWLRPELVVAAATILCGLWLRDRRAGVRALSVALLGLASVVLFRWAMFGTVVPLSAIAKPAELGHGLRYLGALLLRSDSLIACLLAAAGAYWGGARERGLLGLLLAHGLAVVLAGGDWMPGRRLFAPAAPLAAYLVAIGAVSVARKNGRTGRLFVAAALVVGLGASTLELARELRAARAAGQNAATRSRELAALLRQRPGPVAVLDVGAIGYLSQAPLIDLAGLTDPEVAHMPGGHLDKRIGPQWLEAKAPRWILLHASEPPLAGSDGTLMRLAGYPVEHRLAVMPFVRAHYRFERSFALAPTYHYALLLRR